MFSSQKSHHQIHFPLPRSRFLRLDMENLREVIAEVKAAEINAQAEAVRAEVNCQLAELASVGVLEQVDDDSLVSNFPKLKNDPDEACMSVKDHVAAFKVKGRQGGKLSLFQQSLNRLAEARGLPWGRQIIK